MQKLRGTLSPWTSPYEKMHCQWPKCNRTADTTGKLPGGGFGNVCHQHKMIGDKKR